MELVNATRKAIDTGAGPADPAVREAAEATAMILDLFAPHTAEEMWEMLGYEPFVGLVHVAPGRPDAAGRGDRDRGRADRRQGAATLEVSGAHRRRRSSRRLARADARVQRALAGREITRAIVRPPKVVSFSTAEPPPQVGTAPGTPPKPPARIDDSAGLT